MYRTKFTKNEVGVKIASSTIDGRRSAYLHVYRTSYEIGEVLFIFISVGKIGCDNSFAWNASSLALGTPVLNISLPGYEEGRFSGLRELVHSMTEEEFLA